MAENEAARARHPLAGKFFFNANLVFLCTLVSNTTGFIVLILLARSLGPDGRGVAALYQGAVFIAYALFNLGAGQAAFYFVTRREVSARQAAEFTLTVTIVATLATAAGVIAARLLYGEQLAAKHMPYALAVLVVPALIQFRLTLALLRAGGRFGAMNALEIGLPISMLLCIGGTELVVGLDVPSAIWAWSLAYVPLVGLGYLAVGREAWPLRPASPVSVLRAVRFGGQAQVNNLVQMLNYRTDAFMILILLNTSSVGLYTVSTSQTEGLWIIASSVAIVLLTDITAGNAENAVRMTPVVCRNTLFITGLAALGAAVIAALWIPLVFGAGYRDSVWPYLCLLPGTVAESGATILAAYVFSRGRPIINAWIGAATLAITVPTNVALILLLGLPGAAISTSLGYCLNLAFTALVYRKLSGQPIREALLVCRADASLYLDALASALRLWRQLRLGLLSR